MITRSNLIGFRAGLGPVICFCVVCKEEKNIPRTIYTNKKELRGLTRSFIEAHYGRCVMRPIEEAARREAEALKPIQPNTIEILTQRVGKNDFCFYHTVSRIEGGAITHRFQDSVITFREDTNDRLRAAIANLGLAARRFADAGQSNGCIVLENDKDGKDMKFGGEHNILFGLLYPDSYGANKKNASIYASYNTWLTKAKMLINDYRITIKLGEAE